jgi:hypothetical protein
MSDNTIYSRDCNAIPYIVAILEKPQYMVYLAKLFAFGLLTLPPTLFNITSNGSACAGSQRRKLRRSCQSRWEVEVVGSVLVVIVRFGQCPEIIRPGGAIAPTTGTEFRSFGHGRVRDESKAEGLLSPAHDVRKVKQAALAGSPTGDPIFLSPGALSHTGRSFPINVSAGLRCAVGAAPPPKEGLDAPSSRRTLCLWRAVCAMANPIKSTGTGVGHDPTPCHFGPYPFTGRMPAAPPRQGANFA